MDKNAKIYVAGHRGLVGSAIVRELERRGFPNVVLRAHADLDLTNQKATADFFSVEKPEYVFLAAAKVGGIGANQEYPAEFIAENLSIALNVIDSAYQNGAKKLINLGSSCIYPKLAPQPIKEEYLLTGALEPTNEPYAIAKIAAVKLCEAYNRQYGTDFLSLMPTNLYGPGDTYDKDAGHVLPSLLLKFHEAKVNGQDRVTLWGDGSPLREFLFSDDLARAAVQVMDQRTCAALDGLINVGSGEEISIANLAQVIMDTVYADSPHKKPDLVWDNGKPNGTPRKLLDSSRIRDFGWKPEVSLEEGVKLAYRDMCESLKG